MVSADFRQIELRIMAHFSQDNSLCTILKDPLGDPFRILAAQWQQCAEEKVLFSYVMLECGLYLIKK